MVSTHEGKNGVIYIVFLIFCTETQCFTKESTKEGLTECL